MSPGHVATTRRYLSDVQRLLADHVALRTDRFLEPAPLNVAAQLRAAESQAQRVGKRIGAYQLKRLIGSGGMGDVYEAARATDFTQSVAIKILKRGMDSDEMVRRFRNEMQFLADVGKHPHIAGLLDAGISDEGLPYYVMEYVAGERIDQFCSSHNVPVRERLRLFQAVCAAVQFAAPARIDSSRPEAEQHPHHVGRRAAVDRFWHRQARLARRGGR